MTLLRSFFVLALGVTLTASAEQAPTIFPFEPAQLLAALPAAPADWTVVRSEADNSLSDWLETRATRIFSAPPTSSNGPNSGAVGAAGEVEISVTDTAGFASSLAAFSNFLPGKSGTTEKKFIGSLPAIIVTSDDGHQLAQVLISGRFIVEISFTRFPNSHLEDWLRSFHFDLLPQKSATPTTRPREFRLTHVDELHPENNRSYSVSTTSSKRVSDFLKSLPPDTP